MAWNTVTVFMSNSTSQTVTIPTSDYADAIQFVQNAVKAGSLLANDGVTIIPIASTMKLVIS